MLIYGNGVKEAFSMEPGIHRVQRVPPTEKRGRRQTSTVAVAVLQCPESDGCEIPDSDIRIETVRGQGPGGQHRNTSENAVKATHIPTGITAYCDGRSQYRNRQNALSVLSARISEVNDMERSSSENSSRRNQIGDMGRGSRVRTYNIFRGFVKDERVGKKFDPAKILSGNLDLIYDSDK
jgi:peptide chain release factor 1